MQKGRASRSGKKGARANSPGLPASLPSAAGCVRDETTRGAGRELILNGCVEDLVAPASGLVVLVVALENAIAADEVAPVRVEHF